ncbi:MAG: START-like domain-containing protein [Bacteroidota bacterium]|nr:START-like domain-containing protein [Bacteroidota bacterium]
MTRELFQIEYVLNNSSAAILWKLISTASGLSEWFADNVEEKEDILTFQWGDSKQEAERISINHGVSVRYHWCDDPDIYYFELSIDTSEITGGIVLRVTDFAESSDRNSSIELWNSQIEVLMRRTGM